MRQVIWGIVVGMVAVGSFCVFAVRTKGEDTKPAQPRRVLVSNDRSYPKLSDPFPWGADFRKLDRRYRGLVRTWGDMTPFERTRIEQYELEMPCQFAPNGKVRVRFRLKSHRLYEVQFNYLEPCATKVQAVLKQLTTIYGPPSLKRSHSLPKGNLFRTRKVTDWIWHRNDCSINLRYRHDEFLPSEYQLTIDALFVTFRAKEQLVESKQGPSGERSAVQLQSDKHVLKGGTRLNLLFLGELKPNETTAANGTWETVLEGIAKRTATAGLTVASLGVPLGFDCETACPPEFVSAMLKAGIDLVFFTSAVKRCGEDVFATTQRVLEASHIRTVEPSKGYSLFNVQGLRIAAIAFDVDRFDESNIGKALEKVQAETALLSARSDVLIVGMYWDSPRTYCPPELVRRLTETALAAGADVVWGYGNAALSGMMRFGGGVAFFGGGVLVSGTQHPADPEGIAVRVEVNKRGVITYEPLAVASNPPRWLSGEHAKYVISRFTMLSQTCHTSGPPREALEPFRSR